MEKSISELKAEFVCMCVWEKKQQQFLRCIKKDFKFAELNILFLFFRERSINGEGNKLRKRRKYMSKSN